MKIFIVCLLALNVSSGFASQIVNVYVWGGEIPKQVIQQFEEETHIKVNFSTFDNNETMYAKLKTSKTSLYDIVMPSGYYVEKMIKQGMLSPLNHQRLPNLQNVSEIFRRVEFDFHNQYSIPLTWGVTGIFYNQKQVASPLTSWAQLWEKKWQQQLLLLDDSREIFAIGLLVLGYKPNDINPSHIAAAYQKLLRLLPNIKLFASENVQSILIDEDAIAGSVSNGDAFKAFQENSALAFSYPQEGFVIWADCLAIPKNAPHLKEAYIFMNFMLRPEVAREIALLSGQAITNQKTLDLLPQSLKENPMVYPSSNILKNGYFQRDIPDNILEIYNNYWQELKLSL